MQKILKYAVILMMAIHLCACGTATVSRNVAKDGTHAEQLNWLKTDSTSPMHKGGTFPDISDLRLIRPGMNKQQIMDRIGPPHFREGVFAVREWNYLFNFRKPDSGEVVQCFYKVLFDKDKLAQSFYWSPESCAAFAKEPTIQKTAEAAAPKLEQTFTLSADALFAFDKAGMKDVATAGRDQLDDLADKLLSRREAIQSIHITGYTDWIGNDIYNKKLSEQRAETVMRYLSSRGLPVQIMEAEGRGEADPVAECKQTLRTALIACLAPDRRVVVQVEFAPQQHS